MLPTAPLSSNNTDTFLSMRVGFLLGKPNGLNGTEHPIMLGLLPGRD